MGIVDLGLVYGRRRRGRERQRSPTHPDSMGCPVGPWIAEQIETVAAGLRRHREGRETEARLGRRPGRRKLMSEDAKFILGY